MWNVDLVDIDWPIYSCHSVGDHFTLDWMIVHSTLQPISTSSREWYIRLALHSGGIVGVRILRNNVY